MPKLRPDQQLITDKDGRQRIVPRQNPKLDASAKIRQRTSKKVTVVRSTGRPEWQGEELLEDE